MVKKFLLIMVFLGMGRVVLGQSAHQPPFQATVIAQCSANITENLCVESAPIIWNVQISNLDDSPINISGMFIMDTANILLAGDQVEGIIPPEQTADAQLKGIVPPPTRGSTLYYQFCALVDGKISCDQSPRSLVVMPLTEVECVQNATCGQSAACSNFKCIPKQSFPFFPVMNFVFGLVIILLLLRLSNIKHK